MDKICKCKNLKLLIDVVNLYEGLGISGMDKAKIHKSTLMHREKAYTLTNWLLATVSEGDLHSWITERGGKRQKLDGFKRARELNRACSENRGEDCIYALDELRFLIHQDAGIRAKILCEADLHTKGNVAVKNAMNALRGVDWGTRRGAKRILQDLYEDSTCTKL